MDGVVFDFDGVIADTMGQHAEAYRQVLAPHGIKVQDHQIFALEGARSESIIAQLGASDAARLADEKQRVFAALGTPRLYAGAEAMVRDIQTRTAVGLVTGTRRENLQRLIPALLPGFKAVLSQESYTHDKPDPEPYTRAAQSLALDPRRLVCVENAVRGVQSALAAGYGQVIAIATTMDAAALRHAGAHEVADDHDDLHRRLLAALS